MRIFSKFLILLFVICSSCNIRTDPAVHLAYCIKRGAIKLKNSEKTELTISCPLLNDSAITIILYPKEVIKSDSLASLGVPNEIIEGYNIDSNHEHILIFDPYYKNLQKYSYTTYSRKYAHINKLFIKVNTKELVLTLKKTKSGEIEVVALL